MLTKWKMSFIIAARGLWLNKMRSLLTLLGIIIGIAAVITIVSLAEGLQKQITGQVEELGTNLVWLVPNMSTNQRKEQGFQGGQMAKMREITMEEIGDIMDYSPVELKYSPIIIGNRQIKQENEKETTEIYGVNEDYFSMSNLGLTNGDYFSKADVKGMSRVCIMGPAIAKDLFGDKDPVGKDIRIAGVKFKVTGVIEEKGGGFGDQPDRRLYIPYSTAQRQIFKQRNPFFVLFQVSEYGKMESFKEESRRVMNRRRGITNADDEDYVLQSQTDALKQLGGVIKGMVYVFGGIAAVSLLVGGIGIMNIMLVTVTERTREIGLRKAVGAKKSDILMQFLIESIVLCLIGGLFGMLLGYGGAMGISALIAKSVPELTWKASLSPMVIIYAVGISTAIGVLFGVYPASNAAKLNPIDALRYE